MRAIEAPAAPRQIAARRVFEIAVDLVVEEGDVPRVRGAVAAEEVAVLAPARAPIEVQHLGLGVEHHHVTRAGEPEHQVIFEAKRVPHEALVEAAEPDERRAAARPAFNAVTTCGRAWWISRTWSATEARSARVAGVCSGVWSTTMISSSGYFSASTSSSAARRSSSRR